MRGILLEITSLFKNIFFVNKLGTGIILNRRADPNGICLSEKIEAQICGIKIATKNTEDGIEMLKKADESLCQVQRILHKMNELAVQCASGTYSKEQRAEYNKVFHDYKEKVNYIGLKSLYNGISIFDPSKNPNIDNDDYTIKLQIGADAGDIIKIKIEPMNIAILGLANSFIVTQEDSRKSINNVLKSIDMISNRRIEISNTQIKLREIIENQNTIIENLMNAKNGVVNKNVTINELKKNLAMNNKFSYNVAPLMKEKNAN